ncbi:hypothetical protein [Burkholderia multivorans]|uniref:hypothetical protein n=1 Tax=Burkholderia multivorans TaxID=87883 RepID=UPI0020191406|nr:hypothetical protein [Burkholderia multivorans]MCO1368707.1 hypothetical protein [Burkholderia multivorans]MCO1380598.1 hypothetical protein [Burkholderia multivorans]MDN8032038.1 hypothetical protein [Burkholderia multivorans]UQP21976.1 hypothetical protein L0Y98_17670 [Burkholderia multivorans]UQP91576.1 hypothetical protein L0Y91_29615 [Burkholderia multivorans]
MDLIIPSLLMIITLVAVLARLSHDSQVIAGCAMAALFAVSWVSCALRRQLDRWRKQREANEQIVMEQRFPFCHVTRLSSGEWFLTEKETGREYKQPPMAKAQANANDEGAR